MITDLVLKAIEKRLDTIVEANVVPEGEAYPTSGYQFYRVTGDHTDFVIKESTITATVAFSVICSIRTRDFLKQKKAIPYYELLNMQEACFFNLISYMGLQEELQIEHPDLTVTGRIISEVLNTRIQKVFPDFYGSAERPHIDRSSDREAGYLISQAFRTPIITIPFECLSLPNTFAFT